MNVDMNGKSAYVSHIDLQKARMTTHTQRHDKIASYQLYFINPPKFIANTIAHVLSLYIANTIAANILHANKLDCILINQ